MGEIKNSTIYILIIFFINFLIFTPIIILFKSIEYIDIICMATMILLTLFETLIINILINLNNNIIMIEKILEKQYNQQEIQQKQE